MIKRGILLWFRGMILLLLVTVSTTFAADLVLTRPFIGQVRRLVDEQGQITDFFVPIAEERSEQRAVQRQLREPEELLNFLDLLQNDLDPDVRRHVLFELSYTSGPIVPDLTEKLIGLMVHESDELVRQDYLACLSTLLRYANLEDHEILKMLAAIQERMHHDPSWNVKMYAAGMLVWYGDNTGMQIMQEIVEANIPLQPDILNLLPVTLQRIGNTPARALLLKINALSRNARLKLASLWSSYQLDLIHEDVILHIAELTAETTQDARLKIQAVSILKQLAMDIPERRDDIEKTIRRIRRMEPDTLLKQHIQMIEESQEGACDESG